MSALLLRELLSNPRELCCSWSCTGHMMFTRGKKKDSKKDKGSKKDQKKDVMKELMKKAEVQRQLQEAVLRIAKKGEPLDPEMLNPARKRPSIEISEEEKEKRVLLLKDWSRYKMYEHTKDIQQLQGMLKARNKALKELQKVSSTLYEQSLEPRTDLFPFIRTGPMTTPPIPDYAPPELLEE